MKFVNLSAPGDTRWHIWSDESVPRDARKSNGHDGIEAFGRAWCGATYDDRMGGVYPLARSRLDSPTRFADEAQTEERACSECAAVVRSGDWRLRSWHDERLERFPELEADPVDPVLFADD